MGDIALFALHEEYLIAVIRLKQTLTAMVEMMQNQISIIQRRE